MDTIRARAKGVPSLPADSAGAYEVMSGALDRCGVGFIVLGCEGPRVAHINDSATALLGLPQRPLGVEVADLISAVAWPEGGNCAVDNALTGESGRVCCCRIPNTDKLVDISYGPAGWGRLEEATAFLLIAEADHSDNLTRLPGQSHRAQNKRFYIPTFVWQFADGEFVLKDFNDAASAVTQGGVERHIGSTATEVYAERPDICTDISDCYQRRSRLSKEIRYRTQNGTELRDWAMTYTFVPPDQVMVHADDITERKRGEQLLRDREERLRLLVEQVPAVLWSTDTDLCVTSTAGSALASLNEKPGDSAGLSLRQLFESSEEGRHVIEAHETALKGASASYEIHYKDRAFRSHVEPLLGQDGSIIGAIGLGLDVTESKRAEQALRRSEERYRAFVEQSSEGIWRLEVEPPIPIGLSIDEQADLMMNRCYVAECNDAMAQMYGLARASMLLGRSWRDLHVRADSLNVDGLRRFVASGYRILESESHDVTEGGELRYISNNAVGIVEDGMLVRIWGTQRDITERKLAEEERAALLVREKAARLEAEQANTYRAELLAREQSARAEAEAAWSDWQQTFDAMAESVSLMDKEGRLLRANKAFYAWWRTAPEECLGKPMHELAHKDPSEADACPICDLRVQGVRAAIEIPAGVVDERPLYVALDPILDSRGETVGYVQQVKDLSDLYQARAQAERERTSLNATIEQMAEGLLVCDEAGRVIRANRLAQEIFEVSLPAMMADSNAELARDRFSDLQGRVLPVHELPIQRALAERRVIDGSRLWYAKADGDRILLSVVASPFLNEKGELRGAVALVKDVTEQQREHEHLQQVDKMRALGQLSSGVAHNFNNALASILGYTQLALRKANSTELEKYLGIIQKAGQDAARMVERIQNFSRSHPRTGDFRPVRLLDVARDAVEIARPRWRNDAESLGIRYEVLLDWCAREDVLVNGEPSELREVFLNIILNALDAMPAGGHLNISAVQDQETASVSFEDTGAGMTAEIKQRVFEPFFTTKSTAGLGLGLSESYRIIERHGGRIDIDTRLHLGTTFSVILPLSTEPTPTVPEEEPREQAASSLRILVLDDEVFVRGALAAMLKELGHSVTEAASASEAVEIVKKQSFDLVFTDLAMPEVDGIAAAEMLKSVKQDLKLVLMSGYGSDKAAERAGGSTSIDAVIAKPFSFAEIKRVIAQLFHE